MGDSRRALEDENRRLRVKLEELEAQAEQLAYAVSHDLQEPLRGISNYVSLLADEYDGQLDEEAQLYIRYTVESAERMRRMLDGLLTYSRIGRHHTFGHIESDEVLDDAILNLETSIEESGATITKDPLPTVYADRDMLARLFQNLIANGIKFRKEGEPPRIHVSAEDRGDGVWTFGVTDNGIGLDTEHSDRIFTIFQRLVKDRNGTGIGLSICRKIVEMHGGSIWVVSRPEQGASFYFTIGKADADDDNEDDSVGRGQPRRHHDGQENGGADHDGSETCCRPRWGRGSPAPPRQQPPVAHLETPRSGVTRSQPPSGYGARGAGRGES